MKRVKLSSVLMMTMMLSLPTITLAEVANTPIERLIEELADKPQHHQAIAQYYREKAAEARKEMEHHRKMKNSYVSFNPKNPGNPVAMQAHCDKLISAYEAAAKEYDLLAKEHDDAAKTFTESLPR